MTFVGGQKVRASQMPGYVCTSSSRPAGHSGQIIYETDTGMIAIYTGTAWRYLAATGDVASDAEYQASATQTIGTGANTFVAFGNAAVTTPLVVRGTTGAGHYFRLQRPGRWAAACTIRFASIAGSGQRFAGMRVGGVGKQSMGFAPAATVAPVTIPLSTQFRIAVGAENTSAADVDVYVFQDTGSNKDLEFNAGSGWGRISLSWIGP